MNKDTFLGRLRKLELGPEVEELTLVFINYDGHEVGDQNLCLLRFLEFQKTRRQPWDWPSMGVCERYLDLLRAKGYRPGTVRRRFSVVRCWLRFLYRQKRILIALHAQLPQLPPSRRILRRLLSYEQIVEILSWPDLNTPYGLRDRAILETAYATGMRSREMSLMDLEDVDLGADLVAVRHAKSRTQRFLPLTRQAREALRSYLENGRPQMVKPRSGTAVWLSSRGNRLKLSSWTRVTLNGHYQASRRLGVPVTLRGFRQSLATHLVDGGANLREVAELLGHKDFTSTLYYLYLETQSLKKTHQRCHPRG